MILTVLFIALAILAILIYLLYHQEGHKPWLQDCLSSLFYAWILISFTPAFLSFVFIGPKYVAPLNSNDAYRNLDDDNPKTCSIGHDGGCGSMRPRQAKAPDDISPVDGHTKFIWPAQGFIIQDFSSGWDGINISLPVGTQVKAVEEGEVAFASGELKGYGNMILIRHPNGYVSAYAHNHELLVKSGDKVKRGQTIAKSGQTGNVGSPQLHFELRQGSTPVDPRKHLAGL